MGVLVYLSRFVQGGLALNAMPTYLINRNRAVLPAWI